MEKETPEPGKVDPKQLESAVDSLGADFLNVLHYPVGGGFTVLHIVLIAIGLFVLTAVLQKRGTRQRLLPKHCKKCNTQSAVAADTKVCPKCKARFTS